FTANGKGRVEVILAKDGIHNWSEQYRQSIELSSSNETYTLKFNDFTNKSGQKGFSPEDVKTIIFNVLGNGSASSDFEMNVSNVYFGNSLESASGDGIFIPVYPNPFTRSANIEFGVTRDTQVKVEVLNIYGQVVDVIANESMTQGYYKLTWTPVDDKSGVYLFRISIGNDTYTSKVVYQK
ncbi:MAG: T9SS type A sorting domain-containing protein, partial [Bacteroidales bacterium]|nr:T9SS type A sorting domain-containing protein [Bacteroidales bacterium]